MLKKQKNPQKKQKTFYLSKIKLDFPPPRKNTTTTTKILVVIFLNLASDVCPPYNKNLKRRKQKLNIFKINNKN